MRGVASIFEGTLTAASPEALAVTLRDGSDFTFSPSQIERSEILGTRRNTLRGAIVGGGVGLGVGVGLVVRDEGEQPNAPLDDRFGDEFDTWKLIVPPVAGAVLGAFVGYAIRTPRWLPGIMPGTPGDVAFGWSMALGR